VTATRTLHGVSVTPKLPDGWTARPDGPVRFGTLTPGRPATATWTVTVPADQKTGTVAVVRATAGFVAGSVSGSVVGERVVAAQPPPLTTGGHYVSDLPFQSSSYGWGPVERDQSNGENAQGDGQPLRLHDVTYAKGLGVHAPSSVGCGSAAPARSSRRRWVWIRRRTAGRTVRPRSPTASSPTE
jgi:beta-galactosidase